MGLTSLQSLTPSMVVWGIRTFVCWFRSGMNFVSGSGICMTIPGMSSWRTACSRWWKVYSVQKHKLLILIKIQNFSIGLVSSLFEWIITKRKKGTIGVLKKTIEETVCCADSLKNDQNDIILTISVRFLKIREKERGWSKLVFVFAARTENSKKNVCKIYPQSVDE